MKELNIDHVSVRFGGLAVLNDVSASIGSGEMVGLIGPNGAGKTTLFNVMTGYLRVAGATVHQGGSVSYDGKDLTELAAHQIANLGVMRTFQTSRGFPSLSVYENVRIAMNDYSRWWRPGSGQSANVKDLVMETLERVGLQEYLGEPASALSLGQRRLLELARLVVRRPSIVLLDEPFAGLTEEAGAVMSDFLRSLKEDGCTLILVEHNLGVVMSLCERILVLNHGEIIFDGDPEAARNDTNVREAYIG